MEMSGKGRDLKKDHTRQVIGWTTCQSNSCDRADAVAASNVMISCTVPYLLSSVSRNRPCTTFLSSSVGAAFSSDAVLRSTRRILLAGEPKETRQVTIKRHLLCSLSRGRVGRRTFSFLEELLLLRTFWLQRIHKRRPEIKKKTQMSHRRRSAIFNVPLLLHDTSLTSGNNSEGHSLQHYNVSVKMLITFMHQSC